MNSHSEYKFGKFHYFLLILLISLSIWSAFNPRTRQDWLIESLLVWALMVFLAVFGKKLELSKTSYGIMAGFLVLQIYASHYGYMPPIGEWMGEVVGSTRNSYDRFMHLLFGFVFVVPLQEVFEKKMLLSRKTSWFVAILAIFSLACSYEVIEWIVASIVNPDLGTEFVGLQGDGWDAQKDMALAMGGSIVVWVVSLYGGFILRKKALQKS